MRIKFAKPVLTRTVRINAFWNVIVMIALYMIFNFFTVPSLSYQLDKNLDSQIEHEIEHLMFTFCMVDTSIHILNPNELNESDLVEITETPFFLQVFTLDGTVLLESKNLEKYGSIPLTIPPQFSNYYFENKIVGDDELRIGYQKIFNDKNLLSGYIQLATPKSRWHTIENNILIFNLLTFPLLLILIIVVSILLARKSFSPINKIIDLANNISARNLSKRLEFRSIPNDELTRLNETLNNLFDRLESQVKQISDFTDNASHQLMSPLTAIKTELEYILKREHSTEEYRMTLLLLKEQTDKLIEIVKTLLLLSKDCANSRDMKNIFNLSKLLNDNLKPVYFDKKLILVIENDIYLRGRSEYFMMALQNLIDNAFKYSVDSHEVKVITYSENNHVKIEITDRGIGIKSHEKEKIFDKFYRANQNDFPEIKGYGLGLSLVESIVCAMDGRIEVKDNKPIGTVFILSFPVVELT